MASPSLCKEIAKVYIVLWKELANIYYVYGDSSVIINWENEKEALSSLDLDAWCLNIVELKAYFLTLDFQHVYGEHNERADILSKEVLSMATDLLSFTEYYEGLATGEDKLHLF